MYACTSCYQTHKFSKNKWGVYCEYAVVVSFWLWHYSHFQTKRVFGDDSDLEHLNIFLKSHDYEISDNCIEKLKLLVKTPTANLFVSFIIIVMLQI